MPKQLKIGRRVIPTMLALLLVLAPATWATGAPQALVAVAARKAAPKPGSAKREPATKAKTKAKPKARPKAKGKAKTTPKTKATPRPAAIRKPAPRPVSRPIVKTAPTSRPAPPSAPSPAPVTAPVSSPAPTTTTIAPTTTTTPPVGGGDGGRPFAPNAVWNQPLADNAPLDPQSATYVADLLQQVASAGSWLNTYAYSVPVFTVPATQPMVTVQLDDTINPTGPALRQSWLSVPIPPNAQPASGNDAHMVVWQPSTDRMWEFWHMHLASDGWHAQWGGTITNVSTNLGYYTNPTRWGATATSLPLIGGLIRPSELAAGHIDHALAIAIPHARAATFTWPAQRTDGNTWSSTAIPEGQRFRIDPSLDLSTLPMSPLVRMMAVAAQKYGIILRDQSGSVSFYAEDTNAEGQPNPYYGAGGWFQGQYVNNLLKAFPWSHLEALQDTLSCCYYAR